ncbi:glutamine amidotransferase [Streptomyces anulatus]|uniref:class II glutamine amidotransferase n=1 Tax=Streptomyces TaxID=1883 RepID=UPI0006DBC56F|nr:MULTISPECIES: class II glutamine amidotransferase [Streptomyces]KPL30639.1 glutamine amidotransferase [Streptomyces anulatus]MBT1099771.1 class II glutamine amidotransferase [Streptomyces sp. Tu10]
MCRWIAYTGTPVLLSRVLFQPEHSLIDQSLHSRMGVETTNGDGFGVGWYPQDTDDPTPAVLRDVGPAWNNRNLQEVAHHIRSGLFFGHIRASTGTAVQQSNCHPFRHGRWLWMHNGMISEFRRLRRDLALAVDPSLYADVEGSTDSEIMFFLALTFGLADDPPGAVARMAGLVETTAEAHGVPHPLQMTIAVTDGARVWAFRYSSEGRSRSLYVSTRVDALRALHPDVSFLRELSDETRLVVSEPLGDLPGAWSEVPESSYGVVEPGGSGVLHHFSPTYADGSRPQG